MDGGDRGARASLLRADERLSYGRTRASLADGREALVWADESLCSSLTRTSRTGGSLAAL
jgi:hypothetical protein